MKTNPRITPRARLIKKLQTSDQAEFHKWAANIPQTNFFNWSFKSLIESFEKDLCWGYWEGKNLQSVVCFLYLSDPLELLWLATNPSNQGQGFMKRLLLNAINNATHVLVLKDPRIMLEVHEMNLKAIRLYSSLGFVEFGRRKNYYKEGADALLMTLKVE